MKTWQHGLRDGCFSLSVSWCGTSRSKGAENVKTPPLLFFFTNRQKFLDWYWILIQLQSLSTCWMFLMKQSLQRAWWPHGDTFDIDFKFWRRLWLLKLFVALFIARLSHWLVCIFLFTKLAPFFVLFLKWPFFLLFREWSFVFLLLRKWPFDCLLFKCSHLHHSAAFPTAKALKERKNIKWG